MTFKSALKAAALSLALGASLAACSSIGQTPYQAATSQDRGYSETQIERDRWRVSFKGNSSTKREVVEDYLLLRAAELTLQQGFDHFTVTNRDTDRKTRYASSGFSQPRFGYFGYSRRYGWRDLYDPFWDARELREVTRYESLAEIVMGKGTKPNNVNAFDARDVQANLASRVVRPAQ